MYAPLLKSIELNIREANTDDLAQIFKINQQFKYQWSEIRFAEVFEHKFPFFVAELPFNPVGPNNQQELTNPSSLIIGYLVYGVFLDDARILNLAIDQNQQTQGYGLKLMLHALHHAASNNIRWSMLEVAVHNYSAINLYTKLGYQILCRRQNYYADFDGADAYLMHLDLMA